MGISRKEWLDKRSKKMQNKSRKANRNFYYHLGNDNIMRGRQYEYNQSNLVPDFIAKAPKVFSFVNNTEEVIEFFVKILAEINKEQFKQKFIIDSAEVIEVSTDALVYIVAIIQNIKINRIMKYRYSGNLPEVKEAQEVYCESGFFKYVRLNVPINTCCESKIQIVSGEKTDQDTAKQMCLFVMGKLHVDRKYTKTLYKTLIEMMSNAVHHAYYDESQMFPCWYLFAEYTNQKVRIVFLDTGYGIANTVKKKFWEKIGIVGNDSDLIYSAFNGEFRTETNLKNRGLGLPALRNYAISGCFENFFVLSGKGSLKLENYNNENKLTKSEHNNKIYGTIYIFEIAARR